MGKIHLLIVAAAFTLFFAVCNPTVQANEGNTYKVGTDVLTVRSAPAQTADVVGYLKRGDKAVVFDKKFGWAQTYYDGQAVWIASHYLYPADNETATSDKDKASKENNSTAEPQPASDTSGKLSDYSIVLDPGHGGRDSGAVGIRGIREKNHTMKTASSVAEGLREAGASVYMTRDSDTYVSLENRVSRSNKHAPDAFISLHYNAFPLEGVNGFSTYYDTGGAEKTLASDIQSGLKQHMALNSRGTVQNNYHVLRENSDLSVLVELGFVTNPYDASVIRTAEHRGNAADGIVEGITSYFNN